MSPVIRQLPSNLVNQIAAGEVVERPASALKELVENALDAGATQIDMMIRDGGRSYISVLDNGHGMADQDLLLAVERHATSKLADEDLMRIQTLGFRGEALPSIGAVSRLTLSSRTVESETGWKLAVEGGTIHPPEPVAHPQGTKVEIRDLFYATPARLKFLRTAQTETSYTIDVIHRLAMAHPEVAFRLRDERKTVFDFPVAPENHPLARLESILGADFSKNAIEVSATRETYHLTGHVAMPTFNRSSARFQYLFVNGRPVKDKVLQSAVRAAYQDYIPRDRFPVVVLFLRVPSEMVDVNVHPAKTEVRFRETQMIRGLIVGALNEALHQVGHRAASTVAQTALASFRPEPTPSAPAHQASLPMTQQPLKVYSGGGGSSSSGTPASASSTYARAAAPMLMPSLSAPPESTPETLHAPLGQARAQVHGTYILAETKDSLIVVDQHAAHERLVYEKLKTAMKEKGFERQALLVPEVVDLDEETAGLLVARSAELKEFGLILESFGPKGVIVREIPAILGRDSIKGLIHDLSDELADLGEAFSLQEKVEAVLASMACHGSIRAGQSLSLEEMNALLRALEATPHSGQCNHGRPTYAELKRTDIEKLFERR